MLCKSAYWFLVVMLLFPDVALATVVFKNATIKNATSGYLYYENFDGAGTPANWFQGNSADYDYTTTVLSGTESLFLGQNDYATVTFPNGWINQPEIWVKFMYRPVDMPAASQTILGVFDITFNFVGAVALFNDGTLTISGATKTVAAMSVDTTLLCVVSLPGKSHA